MAYLNKEAYERKAQYALNKAIENANIAELNGMTAEEIEAADIICSYRHTMHSMSAVSVHNIFSSEYDDYNRMCGEISKLTDYKLNLDTDDMPSSADEDIDPDYDYDENVSLCADYMERINGKIENYLADIDKKYGTSYCPTGKSRIF